MFSMSKPMHEGAVCAFTFHLMLITLFLFSFFSFLAGVLKLSYTPCVFQGPVNLEKS